MDPLKPGTVVDDSFLGITVATTPRTAFPAEKGKALPVNPFGTNPMNGPAYVSPVTVTTLGAFPRGTAYIPVGDPVFPGGQTKAAKRAATPTPGTPAGPPAPTAGPTIAPPPVNNPPPLPEPSATPHDVKDTATDTSLLNRLIDAYNSSLGTRTSYAGGGAAPIGGGTALVPIGDGGSSASGGGSRLVGFIVLAAVAGAVFFGYRYWKKHHGTAKA